MRLAFAITLSRDQHNAEPPTAMDREPKVPVPFGTMAVSPSTTSMRSIPVTWRTSTSPRR